jgi:hypothetical protein
VSVVERVGLRKASMGEKIFEGGGEGRERSQLQGNRKG